MEKTNKTNQCRSSLRGFTLIEILVAIVVTAIMAAAAIVSLTKSKQGYSAESAMREVSSAIKLTQSYALQGRTQGLVGEASPKAPAVYRFRFIDANTYRIECYGISGSPDCVNPVVEEQNLPNGISLDSPGAASTWLTFYVPHGDLKVRTPNGADGKSLEITVKDASGNTSKLTVESSGAINEAP